VLAGVLTLVRRAVEGRRHTGGGPRAASVTVPGSSPTLSTVTYGGMPMTLLGSVPMGNNTALGLVALYHVAGAGTGGG
jgi:hypothetical protein